MTDQIRPAVTNVAATESRAGFPSNGSLVAAFTPTMDELADGFRSLLLGDLDYREQSRVNRLGPWLLWSIIAVLIGLAIFAAPVIMMKTLGVSYRRWFYPGKLLTLIACLCLGFPVIAWMLRARLDTWINAKAGVLAWQVARKKYWSGGRPTEITLIDDGIQIATDRFREHLRWSAIARCERRGDSIVISPSRMAGYFIPLRAFADESHADSFVAEVAGRQRAVGVHPDDQVAVAAAETKVRCPRCRYNLRGISQARCPECGLAVDAELFLRPAAVAQAKEAERIAEAQAVISSAAIASPNSPASHIP